MKEIQDLKNALGGIQDKEKLLADLFKAFDNCEKCENGCSGMIASFDSWNDATKLDKIKVLSKGLKIQSSLNQKLILILINYVLGGDFYTDSAKTAMKLGGNREDILGKMVRDKMNGNE